MKPKNLYLGLCIIGTALPYWQFLPFLREHGLDVRLIVQQLFANRISTHHTLGPSYPDPAGLGGNMRRTLVAGLALLAFAGASSRLFAQGAAPEGIAPGQETLVAAAQLRLPPRQPLELERPSGTLMAQRPGGKRRQGEILMIVGAAGIVTGLLVDEDVITIAGAGVGGFGLYLYLQATR